MNPDARCDREITLQEWEDPFQCDNASRFSTDQFFPQFRGCVMAKILVDHVPAWQDVSHVLQERTECRVPVCW